MKNEKVMICSFTSLGDLEKGCTDDAILRTLFKAKRFSCFEPLWILNRITGLMKRGDFEIVEQGYPWTGIKFKAEK